MCKGPPKLRYWGLPVSESMAMRGCSCADVVFLTCAALTRQRAACASQSDSITLAGPVSPRTLNVACLRVKVESIKILTARPALNWPCAVFASRRYNAISHGLALGARTHARELPPTHGSPGTHGSCRPRTGAREPCVVRGVGGVGTHAAQHWDQRQVSAVACGRQSTNKSHVNRPADHR